MAYTDDLYHARKMYRPTAPCSARPIADPIVYRLATSWLGAFPQSLNVTLKDFLWIGPFDSAMIHGRVFARKHHGLIREILDNYADSVSLVDLLGAAKHDAEYDEETRCHAFVEGKCYEDAAHPCLERPIVDPIVYRLVTSWLGDFPQSLNVTLKEFLRLGPAECEKTYGPVFARKHRYHVRGILSNYADSVALVDVLDDAACDDDTRCDAFVPDDEYDEDARCDAFVPDDEYDEDARCDAFVPDEYDDAKAYALLQRKLSKFKLSNQRM